MKLTKIKIEGMVKEIIDYLKANGLDDNVCIYFNNKRIKLSLNWDRENKKLTPYVEIDEDMNPLDYFEYANPKHILSMSFENEIERIFSSLR